MNTFELLKLYAAGERDFQEIKLSNAHLVGENLSGINLSRSILWATNLSNTILKRANLTLTS
ncbi:MAG TPA: pentapeptide repeat-containing protein, partial [Coleofasciculaceae cyanobacterium]